jgi:hypothetical protein
MASASAWWLGDWIVYGERTYGDRYRAALERTSFDYKTLRNYAWVARHVDVSRRRDKLSFQHHAEVAALPQAQQDLWLGRAETQGWSRNELRRRLAAERRRRSARRQRGPVVVVRMEIPEPRERRWRQAARSSEQGLAEWLTAVADEAADVTLDPSEENQARTLTRASPV